MTARHPGRMPIRVKVTATTCYAMALCPACKSFMIGSPAKMREAAGYHSLTCYALRKANMEASWDEVQELVAAGKNAKAYQLNRRSNDILLRTYTKPSDRRSGYDAWPKENV